MKSEIFVSAALLLGSVLNVSAQGTTQYRAVLTGLQEVPPNFDPTVGTASLSLNGNSLSFIVDIPAVTITVRSGSINGPASPGSIGPILFDLGIPHFRPGNSQGQPPGYLFGNSEPLLLTDTQVAQLDSETWYMEIFSDQLPTGQLRGQIVTVPEPTAVALWSAGIAVFFASARLKNHPFNRSAKMNR